jgi:protein-S-isoprenylcysteine O-methyltransferase Ste14
MTGWDPYLVVRATGLYLAIVLVTLAWLWARPSRRQAGAALASTCWTLPTLLALHMLATAHGWWRFDATGGTLMEMPVDLYIAWALLWGAFPALVLRAVPLPILAAGAFAVDLALMPAAAPVIRLGDSWLLGEGLALAAVLVPAQLLARWTADEQHLAARAALQALTFAGLVGFVVPTIAFEVTEGRWSLPDRVPGWMWSVAVQLIGLPALLGLSAVQEFVTRGGGTPVPLDPPRRLVTSGLYAYLRNPMQTSGALLLAVLGYTLGHGWLAAGGIVAVAFALGLGASSEDDDLTRRFGLAWTNYRQHVPRFLPRWRPWRQPELAPARLYVAVTCGPCRDVRRWIERRTPSGLDIVPAEAHPTRALTRITYEDTDGYRAEGVAAIARALEHIHLLWALAGCALRLPGVEPFVQVLVDAAGGQPRLLHRPDEPRKDEWLR